jgi:hypothetical protein
MKSEELLLQSMERADIQKDKNWSRQSSLKARVRQLTDEILQALQELSVMQNTLHTLANSRRTFDRKRAALLN